MDSVQDGRMDQAGGPSWRARHSWQRWVAGALIGGTGGLLSVMVGGAVYAVDTMTRASRVSAFDHYTFTPFELDLPWEDVQIPTRQGAPLSGWWLPRAGSDRVVVVCYGYRNRKWEMLGVGAALWRHGYNVLLFDYHGHGDHAGTRVTLGYRELDDALAALEYANSRLPNARLGVIGYSMGAAIAIMAASRDRRVRAVVADSPFAAQRNPVSKRLRRRLPVSQAGSPVLFLIDQLLYRTLGYHFRDVEPLRDIGALGDRPIFLVHGKADSMIDYHDSELLYAAAPGPRELWLLPGVDHCGAYFLDRQAYIDRIGAFFDRTV